MPDALSSQDLAAAATVLSHPSHQAGLQERRWVVDALADVGPACRRVTGTVSGDLTGWDLPNTTVRLDLPIPAPELESVPGAPTTSSRVYTIEAIDPSTSRMSLDLVVHREDSPAMRWLTGLAPGDDVVVHGPRQHHLPAPAGRMILAADSSALPALRSLAGSLASAPLSLVVAPNHPAELTGVPGDAVVVDPACDTPLCSAVAELGLDPSTSVWAGGEREDMRALRTLCRDAGLPKQNVQVYGYWRTGTSSTRLDLARLLATRRLLDQGRALSDLDDFDDLENVT